jgi:hypothetical protein
VGDHTVTEGGVRRLVGLGWRRKKEEPEKESKPNAHAAILTPSSRQSKDLTGGPEPKRVPVGVFKDEWERRRTVQPERPIQLADAPPARHYADPDFRSGGPGGGIIGSAFLRIAESLLEKVARGR